MESAVASFKSERRKQGKALREKCPRTAQAECKPRSKSQDIVKWLEESDRDRIAGLIPLKYQRMSVSPFTFFRGAAIVQARDLANSPVSGITVQACGDCHLANFGGFASPEQKLVFDINDFDETFPGAWEWDLKRLGASLILAARDRNFSKTVADEVVRAAAASYRERMSEFAEMEVIDRWYAQVSIDELKVYFRKDPAALALLSKQQKEAQSQISEAVVPKYTAVVDGRHQIKDNVPVLYHFQNQKNFERETRNNMAQYEKSLPADRLALFERYLFHDAAVKVVGVGSVGTRCYLGLFSSEGDEPLFLQIKEARRSVLESPRGKSRFANQGFRVVTGQRLMQAASDIFLGWYRSPHGHDYYVRQFRDMKVSVEIEDFRPGNLVGYAKACGWTLARAHAKAGDAPMIAGYLGSTSHCDDALVQYARSYADQAERDFATFQGSHSFRTPINGFEGGCGSGVRAIRCSLS
ncbi:MAG TPA: DUF2252 domain-containing protein [Candidatus Limnocylindrales bacterium]|nr:DUF2252 domain-containing protein [Candidatus Limnocylindrales bacterium]